MPGILGGGDLPAKARLAAFCGIGLGWLRESRSARGGGHRGFSLLELTQSVGRTRMDAQAPDRDGPGIVPRLLSALVGGVASRPRLTLGCVLVLVLLAAGVTVTSLRFKTSRADLIDPGAEFQRRWLRYVDKFGDQSDVVVVVEARDAAAIRSILDDLGRRIEQDTEHFQNPLYRIDPSALPRKGLQYLSPQTLESVAGHLEVYAPVIAGNWQRAGIDPYSLSLIHLLKQAERKGNKGDLENLIAQCQLLGTSLERFSRDPAHPQSFQSPWPQLVDPRQAASAIDLAPRYLMNSAETMGFLITTPRKLNQDFSGSSDSIRRLRQLVGAVEREHETASARIGLTGIPILESDEMARSQQDMSWATLISFGGVALILLVGFRGLRHPLLAMLMLATGTVWAIGFTTLAIGHLTILTISFAAILAGLGIDFAIHFLSRYLALRQEGHDLIPALRQTAGTVGTGILTCSLTTALAFGTASFTSFLGVAELGLISAAGIVFCGLAAFLVLPPLVAVADRGRSPAQLPVPFQGTALRWLARRVPGPMAGVGLLVCVGLVASAFDWSGGLPRFRVRYDGNLLSMQARGVESVELQERLFRESDNSLLYAVSIASNSAEARRLEEKFRALPSVGKVEEIASMVPQYPAGETQLLVQAIHARLSRLTPLPVKPPTVDPATAGADLDKLHDVLAARPEPSARAAAASLDRFLDVLTALPVQQQVVILNGYQHGMLVALHTQFERLLEVADPEPVSAADLPAGLRSRFVSPQGDWLLRVFPKEQVWDEAPLARFVAELRSVDPEVTGTPLQNYEAAGQIRQSYLDAAVYALIVVVGLLLLDLLRTGPRLAVIAAPTFVAAFACWTRPEGTDTLVCLSRIGFPAMGVALAVASLLDFRNVVLAVLALLPPVIGGGMLLGVMALAGIDFNPANMIVLPLILGIGVDYGVVLVHDFRDQKGEYAITGSTINSLLLTSTTTMAGFGSMLVAAHQGLVSLGLVLLIGMACTLFVALVPLAATLSLLAAGRAREIASKRRLLEHMPAIPTRAARPASLVEAT